jgi:hypothetical protein
MELKMTEEEKKGAEVSGDADLDAGAKADVAGSQDTGGTVPDAGESKDVEGLKTAAIEERKKRQEAEQRAQYAEEQARAYQQQLQLVGANKPQPTPNDEYSQFGLGDDDLLTVAQQRQIEAARFQKQQAEMEVRTFISQHPDFGDIVGTFGPNGLLQSPKLQEALRNDPGLMSRCNTPLGLIHAYNDIKLSEYQKQFEQTKHNLQQQQVQEQVDNAQRIASISSVGGAGATGGKVDWTKASKEDFDKYDAEVARGRTG